MMTTSKTAFVSIALLCGLGFSVTACPASLDDRCADGACVSATSQGEGGIDVVDGGGPDAPIPVDPCVNTPTDPKCLDEGSALFVSAKADAGAADGSRLHPFKTIAAGLAAVNGARKRVYVCEGDYLEKVSVQTTVSILGGLACDWMSKGANPRIAPPKGVALSIVKSSGVVVTDVDVEGSADPLVDGDSAIGAFVSESQGVLLRRVTVKAGPGTKGSIGANGVDAPNYINPIATKGGDTGGSGAGAAPSCGKCVDNTLSTGGAGGAAGGLPTQGTATPAVGSDNSGASGGSCVDGKPGAPGVAAAVGAAAATGPGALKAAGWDSSSPTAKKWANGNPGQGGGGGGATAALGGGGGGCGGCGGNGGAPGGNGGSSFALLVFEADVTVEDSPLTSSSAGPGGNGGNGQDGQVKGGAGSGVCSGGVGGHGAGGGGGGGGAGGQSAAIAHSGKAPTPKNCTLKHALGGDVGTGGTMGVSTGNPGAAGNNGAKGLEADILPL